MAKIKAGKEQEYGVYGIDFLIRNKSSVVINNDKNKIENGGPGYVIEGTQSQFEYNSNPHNNVNDHAAEWILKQAQLLEFLREADEELIYIPTCENGTGRALPNLDKRVKNRTRVYDKIFGDSKNLITISGTHYHIDKVPGKFKQEYDALIATIPSIAFSANSPFTVERVNGLNCSRRNVTELYFSKFPESIEYTQGPDQLEKRDRKRHRDWRDVFVETQEEAEHFDKTFLIPKTGYPDLRHRPDIGNIGTLEARWKDSPTSDISIADTGFMLGYITGACNTTNFGYATTDGDFEFSKNRVVLPTQDFLVNEILRRAKRCGLEDTLVREYHKAQLEFASEHLDPSDHKYLTPLHEMIESGDNLSSKILKYVKGTKGFKPDENGRYTVEAMQAANEFIYQRELEGMVWLKETYKKR